MSGLSRQHDEAERALSLESDRAGCSIGISSCASGELLNLSFVIATRGVIINADLAGLLETTEIVQTKGPSKGPEHSRTSANVNSLLPRQEALA